MDPDQKARIKPSIAKRKPFSHENIGPISRGPFRRVGKFHRGKSDAILHAHEAPVNSSDAHPMDIQPVMPEPQSVGASPPPRWYDPRFSKAVTILSAIILSASVTLVVWFAVDIPKLGRVADPEKALGHMVSRMMDVEEGFRHLATWERFLYEVTMGSDASERDQAITWYEELVEVSPDPLVDLNLAILLAESGRVQEVTNKITEWTGRRGSVPAVCPYTAGRIYRDPPVPAE